MCAVNPAFFSGDGAVMSACVLRLNLILSVGGSAGSAAFSVSPSGLSADIVENSASRPPKTLETKKRETVVPHVGYS